MRRKALAIWPNQYVSWKRMDGELILGIAVEGNSRLSSPHPNHCWWYRMSSWETAALFQVSLEYARAGYLVGYLLSPSDARLGNRVGHSPLFAFPIAGTSCEVFVTDGKGERSLPFRRISTITVGEFDMRIPLF